MNKVIDLSKTLLEKFVPTDRKTQRMKNKQNYISLIFHLFYSITDFVYIWKKI